jgi:FlaA1/EpsC-like NDP-sugar epimerase
VSKILLFEDDIGPSGLFRRTCRCALGKVELTARAFQRHVLGHRRPAIVAAQVLLLVVANYLAFCLRFDGSVPERVESAFLLGLPVVLVVRGLLLHRLRLFGGLWRYAGTWDLRNLTVAATLASAVLLLVLPLAVPTYPRSVIVMDGILAIFLLGGLRLLGRTYRERGPRAGSRRVLIFGAGDAGAMVAREMRQNPAHGMFPVGFVDDDPSKRGCHIDGVPVLGSRIDLSSVVGRLQPHEILIAIPRLPADSLRTLLADLARLDLPLKILPSFEAMLDRRGPLVSHARPLAIEDLLRRERVTLDSNVVRALIANRRILITGAGGSIGSELCRQVASFGPAALVMLDRYENGLYSTEQTLIRDAPTVERSALIADVTDRNRIDRIFAAYRPEIVFHAAAHKHVPLMELNPSEAIKNNVAGTRVVAEAALEYEASRFILISTDKAVNPTSVMGATKRVAELVTRRVAHQSRTTVFAAVRFGNVLGSNGSVVPLFMQQIEAGGPLTVTHPEIRRFFMLIPEAVELVLHAASMARQCQTYILDMGDQIKVADVARDLIRLSAQRRTDGEIRIEYIGLRPGEKLYEELVGDDELLELSDEERIHRVRSLTEQNDVEVDALVSRLIAAARAGDDDVAVEIIKRLVPTFLPSATHELGPPQGLGAGGQDPSACVPPLNRSHPAA